MPITQLFAQVLSGSRLPVPSLVGALSAFLASGTQSVSGVLVGSVHCYFSRQGSAPSISIYTSRSGSRFLFISIPQGASC